MSYDVAAIRVKLAQMVLRAEVDENFRARLAEAPSAVFDEEGIPDGSVAAFSKAVRDARFPPDVMAGNPTDCIHTEGCNDLTCITSHCPASCYVTIKIDAPDA